MDFRGFIDSLKQLRARLENDMPLILLSVVVSRTSIIRNRSIDNGIFVNAQEGNTVGYSDKKAPTYLLWNKARNQSGRDYIKKNKLGNWHEFRIAQGLSSDAVNLSYTGSFWGSLMPGSVYNRGGVLTVEVGVTDSGVAQYAGYLVDRYGNFYDPTDSEQREASDEKLDLLERTVKQYL